MFADNTCNDTTIAISDDVIVIDSSIETINSDSIITISDTSCSVINISDVSDASCVVISDDDDKVKSSSFPSFDFETSLKMRLPQPRTSTPFFQRSAADSDSNAVDDDCCAGDVVENRECKSNSFVFPKFVFRLNIFNLCFFDLTVSGENGLDRDVGMDDTTISFNFDVKPPLPPAVPIEPSRSNSSMEVSSQPSINSAPNDSMLSGSFCFVGRDPQDCEPFMDTPEPSMSPPVFDAISISDAHHNIEFDEPVSPISDNMSYEPSSPLALLPMLPQPVYDSQVFLSTFELEFLDNEAYERFILQHHPLAEIDTSSPYERSERSLSWEQL